MTTSTTIEDAVAAAIAGALPSVLPVTATATTELPAGLEAVTATYVGQQSVEVGIALDSPDSLLASTSTAPTQLSVAELLRPALEAGGGVLGAAVVDEVRSAASSVVFEAPGTVVYRLATDRGSLGFLAVRAPRAAAVATPDASIVASRLNRIENVEMTLTVEIGRARMPIRNVLGLEPGAVVELDRSVGAPADILVNGRAIARGEIVVVEHSYAIRVTEILDPADAIA